MEKPEILAPAGSYESLMAGIGSGADAVYLGGSSFGARAYAGNLTTEQIKESIDYVHYHGKRLYLTVNTLLKEEEQKEQLYDYVLPFYEVGLDAVIVQDVGVLRFLHREFPDLPLHASTQMTITATEEAKLLKQYGVTRIVPARELSLKEIQALKTACGLEIECFVHGALCYCYSGQCLMSSMIGGRSGNRGRCAQPCRLPYEVFNMQGEKLNKKEEIYRLSPKDLCALSWIPQMVQAGVNSFKIEGRMKKAEYVASVTSMYRKYLDLFWENPDGNYEVEENDYKTLMELYNRGGFTDGYYHRHNGVEMMSMKRPNHQGVFVGKIEKIKGNQIHFQTKEELHKKDVLEIRNQEEAITELTSPVDAPKGTVVALNANQLKKLRVGQPIYRMKNKFLIESMQEVWNQKEKRIALQGECQFEVGKQTQIKIVGQGIEVIAKGAVAEQAKQQPMGEEKLRSLLQKTGGTEYYFDSMRVQVVGDVFLPVQAVKELRRNGIREWERAVAKQYRRQAKKRTTVLQKERAKENDQKIEITATCLTQQQFEFLLQREEVDSIYLELSEMSLEEAISRAKQIKKAGKDCYLAFPQIFRTAMQTEWERERERILSDQFDGYLIRNLEQVVRLANEENTASKKWVFDSMLYQYNQEAIEFYEEIANGHTIITTFPLELNYQELKKMSYAHGEIVVYGRIPVMVSAQCQWKQNKMCTKTPELWQLSDRLQNKFLVHNHCKYCYNTIYNSQPLNLFDQGDSIRHLPTKRVRLQFTEETIEQMQAVLEETVVVFRQLEQANGYVKGGTRGHWKRGIE